MGKTAPIVLACSLFGLPITVFSGNVTIDIEISAILPEEVEYVHYGCSLLDASGRELGHGGSGVNVGSDGAYIGKRRVTIQPVTYSGGINLSGQVEMLVRASRYRCGLGVRCNGYCELSQEDGVLSIRFAGAADKRYQPHRNRPMVIVTEGQVRW